MNNENKISFLDILKGLIFIFLIIFIIKLFPLIFYLTIFLIYWIGDTVLFFLPQEYKTKLLFSIIGLLSIIIIPFAIAFGKATGETFGTAAGYRAMTDLKSHFRKKNNLLYYIIKCVGIIIIILFFIGMVIKINNFNYQLFLSNLNMLYHKLIKFIDKTMW